MTGPEVAESSPTIVIPIHNAVDALDACLGSLLRTLPAEARVHLADDASTDPAIPAVIDGFRRRAKFSVSAVRRVRNLGFIGNVNLAFAEHASADVVLLNSDTLASRGWLARLIACVRSDPRIATATPWSNNAEICSFPDFCQPGPLPEDIDALAEAAAELAPAYPELPTGVGFCMYVRRAALDRIGNFDAATFGRGYGEENDFCLRASAHGWRNVLCNTAYVGHQGGASFSLQGHHPGGENLARLNARYPEYNARVAEFILRDPLEPLRDRFAQQLATRRRDPAQGALFT
jgi:GT2 family glycosyltransferase